MLSSIRNTRAFGTLFLFACCALLTVVGCGDNYGTPTLDSGVPDGMLGVPCPKPPQDSDDDNISDEDEGASETPPRDTDHDGVPDYLDHDSDNDGIPDIIEGHNGNACTPPVDTDHDGVADFRDLDSDDANDSTIPDHVEAGGSPTAPVDTDGDGVPDYRDDDDDGDGIPDILEMTAQGASKATSDPATVPDTDHDGIPDYLDLDSDDDNISDRDETLADSDGDLIPNYRDLDSDNDCVPDRMEAGDANLGSPPLDTDGDGAPDFIDIDSDNDGLVDGSEDLNCNGQFDSCETSRILPDSDGDSVTDLIEHEACLALTAAEQAATACSCDGDNINVTPQTHGETLFVVPFEQAPTPATQAINLSTDVNRVDVVFAIDSTTSMLPPIDNLNANLSEIIAAVVAQLPDAAFGVYSFRDFGIPQDSATSTPPNVPSMQYAQRLETVTGAGELAMESALFQLEALGGGDAPQAGWSALWTLAHGTARDIAVTATNTYALTTTASALPLSTGELGGTLGGAGFRAGALPIVVALTDAEWHDAPSSTMSGDSESGLNPYPSTDGQGHPACNPCTGVPSRREAISALQALGARVIGLAGRGTATFGDPKTRALKLAQETSAIVTPQAFGPVGTRPSACPVGQCCTALDSNDNVIGEASLGGQCPLSFTVDSDTGNGVADAVVAGVTALAASLTYDVHPQAVDVDAGAVESFLLRLEPDLSGTGGASLCLTNTPSPLQDNFTGPLATPGADGVLDTFPGLGANNLICFDVVPKTNNTVQATAQPQLFRATVQLSGKLAANAVNLGSARSIIFVVPPLIINPPPLD